jgi:hypothetical protein
MTEKGNDGEFAAITRSTARSIRFYPIAMLAPSLSRVAPASERYLGVRDALQVAMALELHKRSTGSYPPTLDELSPRYLPVVPVDPITGGLLRYEIVDGKPLIYSVGADGDDDGGSPPLHNGYPANHRAAQWHADQPADGDWILFPEPRIMPATTGPTTQRSAN